jgi:hypothetical protein
MPEKESFRCFATENGGFPTAQCPVTCLFSSRRKLANLPNWFFINVLSKK